MTTAPSWQMGAGRRFSITLASILATTLPSIDIMIASVALPQMQGAMSVTSDQISWVLTSYVIALAVMTPAAGPIAARIGRRRLFLLAVAGFTGTSMLCGLSWSLEAAVISRVLQGVCAAAVVPVAQAVLLDSYPPERQGEAMSYWTTGVMIGPIIGPWMGGWLTDQFSWSWIFYVNLPFGVLAYLCIAFAMPDDEPAGARPFDGFGFATLSFALVCLQLVLDRGERAYWFDSWLITGMLLASLGALWVFAVHSRYSRHPYIPSELFRDRNYVGSMVVTAVTSGVFMSNVSILAPMMQSVLGYTARDAGFMIGPRGITVVLGVAVANYARRYIADRTLIAIGLVGAALSIWEMTTFSIETDQRTVLAVGMAQGFWYGIHFVPLMTVTFATLAPHLRTDGAALVQLFRQLVGGIGIAITFSSINHNMHGWSQELRGRVNVDADAWWSVLGHYGVQGTSVLQSEIARQAALLAFEHAIGWLAVALVLMLPLLLLIRGGKTGTSPQVVPGDVP